MSKNAFFGLVVLVLVGIVVLFILGMYAFSSFAFSVEFKDIKGLKVGDRVYLRGVDIGQVSEISMPVGSGVRTTLKINRKYREHLKSDSNFFIKSDSFILGKKCITMHVHDESSPPIQKNQVFDGSHSWELYLLKGKNSLKQIPGLAQSIAEDLDEASPELRKKMLKELAKAKGFLGELAEQIQAEAPEKLEDFKKSLSNGLRDWRDELPEIAAELEDVLGKLREMLRKIMDDIKEKL